MNNYGEMGLEIKRERGWKRAVMGGLQRNIQTKDHLKDHMKTS